MSYKKGDILVTAFPFAESLKIKKRPVVVLAGPFKVKNNIQLYWTLMITSTELSGWKGDIEIYDIKKAGLPIKSIIRTVKMACIDDNIISRKIGKLDKKTQQKVEKEFYSHLNF